LKDLLKYLLDNKNSLNKLSEIYINFHFNIIKVLHHQELLVSFINKLEKKIILFPIDKLLNNINNINGYYFTYYYLYYPEKVYKIPKFIYYKLESNYNSKKFLLFNSNNNLATLDENISLILNTGSNKIDNIKNINIDFHNNLINLLLINIETINIKNASYRNNRNFLPPSVYVILPDFYKFNKIKIIIDLLSSNNIKINISDKINTNLVTSDSEIYNDYIIAKLTEELIYNQANYFTDINSITFFKEINNINDEDFKINLLLKPTEFNINISKFNLNNIKYFLIEFS
jgi:hypothetical protein